MTINEAAEMLGVSRTHIYRLVERGQLTLVRHPLYKKGAPVRILREQVEKLRQPKEE